MGNSVANMIAKIYNKKCLKSFKCVIIKSIQYGKKVFEY